MKMYIFICARVQHKKKAHILRENWNKTNALINVPRKETHHESDDWNRIGSREFTCLPLFALLVTHKEKHQSRMPVNLEKTKLAPADGQAGSSSHTFHPEVTSAGGKVKSKKLYRLKRKLQHSQFVSTVLFYTWCLQQVVRIFFA